MRVRRNATIFIALFLIATIGIVLAQNRASPHETIDLTVGGKKISITYGRPSMKGRQIMGKLVPYGEVWRTGADEATTLTTDADLMIGTLMVPKGTYALFTLPTATGWKLIVNKVAKQWGAFKYEAGQDLGRVDMKVGKSAAPVEQFTMSLAAAGNNGGTLKLAWETTTASVDFKVK